MSKEQMTILAQRQLEAYNLRDLDAFCACFHPEVKIHNLVTGVTTFENLIKFREIFETVISSSPKLHCELRHRIVIDSAVIDHEWVTGMAKYPEGIEAIAIYGFRDGLIDRMWFPR